MFVVFPVFIISLYISFTVGHLFIRNKELGYPYSVYKGTYSYVPVHPWFFSEVHVTRSLVFSEVHVTRSLVFSEVHVTRSLVLCVMFNRSLFVLLFFIFCPLRFLFFFDLRILITSLVSSNSL